MLDSDGVKFLKEVLYNTERILETNMELTPKSTRSTSRCISCHENAWQNILLKGQKFEAQAFRNDSHKWNFSPQIIEVLIVFKKERW